MKTAREIFGELWREVDVLQVATPTARRACAAAETHSEILTFGMACNAMILSLRRVDDVDRRHYSGGRERYMPLRAGVWTLRDMVTVYRAWRAGERYVHGMGPACEQLMELFFVEGADQGHEEKDADPWSDVMDIFMTILDVAQAAQCVPVRQRVGRPEHLLMDQFLQNITELACDGLKIAEHGMTGKDTARQDVRNGRN